MVVLRFRRQGKKNHPVFRLVAADHRFPRDGRFLEILGTYHPKLEKGKLSVKLERVRHWLELGARPSKSVYQRLKESHMQDLGGLLTKYKP